jgi:hypothetical protein
MISKENLLRNARISNYEQHIKETNFRCLKLVEDIRSYLDPVEHFSDMSRINIEKAEILFRELKLTIQEMKDKKEELEYLKDN